jgi:hypothetical protein
MTYRALAIAAFAIGLAVPAAAAQVTVTPDTISKAATPLDPERRTQMARRSGGVRVGSWNVRNLATPSGGRESETPAFEGYVRKGIDAHLALENSIGFWRRREVVTASGGPIGGSSTSTLDAYIVPQQTAIIFYPVTGPEQRLEPFLRGGVGVTMGVEDRKGDGGSLFTGGSGVSFAVGFGATAGPGLEWRPTNTVGLAISGRYQWVRFLQEFAGRETYQGLAADLGITYRFQFR